MCHGKHNWLVIDTKPSEKYEFVIWDDELPKIHFWKNKSHVPNHQPENKYTYPLVMTNIAIENDPVEIVDFPIKNGGSFHSYVKLPEGKISQNDGEKPHPNLTLCKKM